MKAGKYGHHLHFWDWSKRKISKSIDLGEKGMIPLEVRFQHNPDSAHGFVGAALSSVMWHFFKDGSDWKAEKVIEVEGQELKGWDFPVPGLISDLVVSLDDQLALLLELAPRRHPPIRHQRPLEAEAHRPGLGRRAARERPQDSRHSNPRRSADAATEP